MLRGFSGKTKRKLSVCNSLRMEDKLLQTRSATGFPRSVSDACLRLQSGAKYAKPNCDFGPFRNPSACNAVGLRRLGELLHKWNLHRSTSVTHWDWDSDNPFDCAWQYFLVLVQRTTPR